MDNSFCKMATTRGKDTMNLKGWTIVYDDGGFAGLQREGGVEVVFEEVSSCCICVVWVQLEAVEAATMLYPGSIFLRLDALGTRTAYISLSPSTTTGTVAASSLSS